MTDKSVIYQAISYFDRYYDKSAKNLHVAQIKFLEKSKDLLLNPEEDNYNNSYNTIKSLEDLKTYEDFLILDIKKLSKMDIFKLK